MSRSVWKGPFVDGYLFDKVESLRASGRNDIIRTWSRRSTIMPDFVGLTFSVYNGVRVLVSCAVWAFFSTWRSTKGPLESERAIYFFLA